MSAAKASLINVDWLSLISGPTLDVLKRHLDNARATNHIPYANTLGQFIPSQEAAQRYANLTRWYQDKGHFWIGTGPFYVDSVHPVESTVVLEAVRRLSGSGQPVGYLRRAHVRRAGRGRSGPGPARSRPLASTCG